MSSKSSPMPFPFLPVVLPPSSPAKTARRERMPDGPARASGAGGRAARHGAERMAPPPAMDEDGIRAFRVEVVRRTASEGLTLLGAIVR